MTEKFNFEGERIYMTLNNNSLDTLCAALCYAIGIDKPEFSADPSKELCEYVDQIIKNSRADRVFMYNPDAVAQWIYNKYPQLFTEVLNHSDIEVPFLSVMPSVTPVCFGTMYTGAQPCVHGIRKYEKPVISIDTIFDALIRAGKKPVIIAYGNCSLSKIFLERKMDYFILNTVDEVNAKAAEIILEDKYDFIVVYNGNYDSVMHKKGPGSIEALSELRANVRTFAMFCDMIKTHWKNHNSLVGFAMDHGCHEIDESCGSHGLDMPEDLNITHFYKIYTKEEE
jgi:predicted AlkP superfamily pyrophosphatase or phosphodiesterase